MFGHHYEVCVAAIERSSFKTKIIDPSTGAVKDSFYNRHLDGSAHLVGLATTGELSVTMEGGPRHFNIVAPAAPTTADLQNLQCYDNDCAISGGVAPVVSAQSQVSPQPTPQPTPAPQPTPRPNDGVATLAKESAQQKTHVTPSSTRAKRSKRVSKTRSGAIKVAPLKYPCNASTPPRPGRATPQSNASPRHDPPRGASSTARLDLDLDLDSTSTTTKSAADGRDARRRTATRRRVTLVGQRMPNATERARRSDARRPRTRRTRACARTSACARTRRATRGTSHRDARVSRGTGTTTKRSTDARDRTRVFTTLRRDGRAR